MHSSAKHIDQKLQAFRKKQLFVACSGGVDSMFLLATLHRLGYSVHALHVNYNLRGQASIADEQFVETYCTKNTIPFQKKSIQLNEQLKDGGNLQELARTERYNWFTEVLAENSDNYLVLGHHADDQVETFFLNLARKSGVMGLAAMPFEHGRLLRPLLDFSKNEIYDYSKELGIEWREDQSNSSNTYRRNLLRNKLLPEINKEIPTLQESTLLLVQHFQQKQLELESMILPLVEGIKKEQKLSVKEYTLLDEFEKVEFCRQLGCAHTLVDELSKLGDAQKGKRVNCSPSETAIYSTIVKDVDHFTFIQEQEQTVSLILESVDQLPSNFSKELIFLDQDKLEGELQVRQWKIGDRIHPIGIKGSSLISDIISDAKLNAIEKQNVFVVHDDITIHWCVGLKIGRKAIANTASTKILQCSISPTTL
ncbi:MAG: tRNA lysidine(34) synthetase TilS [Crocinitomicaceae bacterium]|nr:tRNA lysidine(34) synthetase TilS [Crocinitomicaceae bacterium]